MASELAVDNWMSSVRMCVYRPASCKFDTQRRAVRLMTTNTKKTRPFRLKKENGHGQ